MERKLSLFIFYLLLAQVAVVLVSWLLTAMMPTSSYHTLLSGEGVRWMFRSFSKTASSPLVTIVLFWWIAAKILNDSGYLKGHSALMSVVLLAAVCAMFVACLLLLPYEGHAGGLLLSATGGLRSSPLAMAMPYLLPLLLSAVAIIYGFSTRKWRVISDPFVALTGKSLLPLILIIVIQLVWLWQTVIYVKG